MKATGKRIAIGTGLVAVAIFAIAAWVAWPHLRFWYLFESLGMNAQGYPEYKHRQTGIVMVKLPGGTFWMGAQKTDPNGRNYDLEAEEDEGPVHEVTLNHFLIAKYEVSRGVWASQMGGGGGGDRSDDALPMESVSWFESMEFCRRLGMILPTESQWEFACRAGTTGPYPYGEKFTDGEVQAGSWNEPLPVDSLVPNGFGLHHMCGNVDEWCLNDYIDSTPAAFLEEYKEVIQGDEKALRGGRYYSNPRSCRSADRGSYSPGRKEVGVGFRPVISQFE